MMLSDRIYELLKKHGSFRAVARVLDIDQAYLWRLYSGEKKDPGAKILRKLGLRKYMIVSYEKVKS